MSIDTQWSSCTHAPLGTYLQDGTSKLNFDVCFLREKNIFIYTLVLCTIIIIENKFID